MKGGRPEWIWSWQPKVAGKGTSGGVKSQQTNYKTKNGKLGSAVWTWVNWLEDTIQTWSLLVATKKRSLCQKTLYNHGNLPQDIITHIISFLAQRGHKHNFWTDLPLPLQTHHISPNRSLNLHVLATYGIF